MIVVQGLDAVLARVKSASAGVRAMEGMEVVVESSFADAAKAASLMAHGRNVFAQDPALKARIVAFVKSRLFSILGATGTATTSSTALREVLGIWNDVGEMLVEVVKKRLDDQEETPGGKRALSAAYAARKLKQWGAKPIGVASGALRDNLRHVLRRRGG